MVGRLVQQMTAVVLAFAMLVAPALAVPSSGCGKSCCQRAKDDVATASLEASNCCASSSSMTEALCSATHKSLVPCHVCCGRSSTAPPSVPPSRDQRLEMAAEFVLAVGAFVAPLANTWHSGSFSASEAGPFWSAADGPSRQAFLCRFTT
jgi:hypothetical protein